MPKKRKLNSKNPKYLSDRDKQTKPIKKRVEFCKVKGVTISGIWYE